MQYDTTASVESYSHACPPCGRVYVAGANSPSKPRVDTDGKTCEKSVPIVDE